MVSKKGNRGVRKVDPAGLEEWVGPSRGGGDGMLYSSRDGLPNILVEDADDSQEQAECTADDNGQHGMVWC